MNKISKKNDVLISLAYSLIISLGLACYGSLILMKFLAGPSEHPYEKLFHKCLFAAACVMLITLIIFDCNRGRKIRGALLMRLVTVIVTVIPGVYAWAFFFDSVVTPLVHFVRALLQ